MNPERAEAIPWRRCSRLNLHDGRVVPVSYGSAEYVPYLGAIVCMDASQERHAEELEFPVELVQKVTCGRGFTSYASIMRELKLTTEDVVALGLRPDELDQESRAVSAGVEAMHAADEQVRERRGHARAKKRHRAAVGRLGDGRSRENRRDHSNCDHPSTSPARRKCNRNSGVDMEETA